MRVRRSSLAIALSGVAAVVSLLPGCGGGGGGGGGPPSLFPAGVTAQDLVAARFSDPTTGVPTVLLGDVGGRGQHIVPNTGFVAGGFVDDIQWSPDHSLLAVFAKPDATTDDVLYVVQPLTGVITPVSGPQAPGTSVHDFRWAPDGSRLAFSRSGLPGTPLFVVNADGTGLVEVSGAIVAGGFVEDFAWSPDSTRLAIEMSADVAGTTELYVVGRDGAGRVKVSGTPVAGAGLGRLRWSPDSSRLAYVGNLAAISSFEAFVSLATGVGGRTRIHPALVAGGRVQAIEWAPDGSRIAYTADQESDEVVELFTSLPDGTGNVKVSGSLVAGGDVGVLFAWAPNSTRIAFLADKETDEVFELFTVLADGSAAPVKVSGALVPGGDVASIDPQVRWSPDSSLLAYVADQELDDAQGVFVTLAASASPTRISPAPIAADRALSPSWTADSSRVVFTLVSAGSNELRIAPTAGPSVAVVPAPLDFPRVNPNPFSFAGDRIVVEFAPGNVPPLEIHAFLLSTLAETVVATPGVDGPVDDFE